MSKGRILVVEDDLDISQMLRLYFDSQGYEVLTVTRGNDALEMCRKKQPCQKRQAGIKILTRGNISGS